MNVFCWQGGVLPKNLFIYASFSCSLMTVSSYFFLKGAFIDMSVCVGGMSDALCCDNKPVIPAARFK